MLKFNKKVLKFDRIFQYRNAKLNYNFSISLFFLFLNISLFKKDDLAYFFDIFMNP